MPDTKAAVDRAAAQYRRSQEVIEAQWAKEGFKPAESNNGFRGDFDQIDYVKPTH